MSELLVPDQLLLPATVCTGAAATPSTLGPFDVAAWDNLIIRIVATGTAGTTDNTKVVITHYANDTTTVLSTTTLAVVRIADTLVVRVRCLASAVALTITGDGAGNGSYSATLTVLAGSRPMPHDGPYTPLTAGFIIGTWSDVIAAAATVSHHVLSYCGPAMLVGEAADNLRVELVDANSGFTLAVCEPAKLGASPWAAQSVPGFVASTLCDVQIKNLAAAQQTISTTLAATGVGP